VWVLSVCCVVSSLFGCNVLLGHTLCTAYCRAAYKNDTCKTGYNILYSEVQKKVHVMQIITRHVTFKENKQQEGHNMCIT